MTTETSFNILFLCTGNSARSIIGEALVNHLGGARFRGFSAGSFPKGSVHPGALAALGRAGVATDGLRSKSWDEFAAPGTPEMDFIFTVCDNAAGEVCPIWPGKPMTAHWGLPDPAVLPDGPEQDAGFTVTLHALRRRIELFTALPLDSIESMTIAACLRDIHADAAKAPN